MGKITIAFLIYVLGAFAQYSPPPAIIAITSGGVGGSANLTTVGAVPYVCAAGVLCQDQTASGQFFWDSINHRLGLGTVTPTSILQAATGTAVLNGVNVGGGFFTASTTATSSNTYGTGTNCASAASPAVCASAASGAVVVAASATTVVVNTVRVTANSQIQVTFDSSLGSRLSVTCNTTVPALYGVSARVAGTSFTITATAPTTDPACFNYTIIN